MTFVNVRKYWVAGKIKTRPVIDAPQKADGMTVIEKRQLVTYLRSLGMKVYAQHQWNAAL